MCQPSSGGTEATETTEGRCLQMVCDGTTLGEEGELRMTCWLGQEKEKGKFHNWMQFNDYLIL